MKMTGVRLTILVFAVPLVLISTVLVALAVPFFTVMTRLIG